MEQQWRARAKAAARGMASAGGHDMYAQYGGFDAETPTRRALQRFEVLSLSHGRFADLSQLAEMGALVEVNLNFNGVSSLAGLRECR